MAAVLDYGITADLQEVDVEIPDPYTLVVTLPQPAAYFLHLLAHPLAAPKPRHVVERYGDAWTTADHIVCNGPFLLDCWDTEGGRLYFVRNPLYHGISGGNVTAVEALYFRQPTGWQAQLQLYEQDQIDFLRKSELGRDRVFTRPNAAIPSTLGNLRYLQPSIVCFDTTSPPV